MGSNYDDDYELAWDAEISKEAEFELLPAGTYDFTVENFERGRYAGSDKMKPCPTASLTLRVVDPVSGASGRVFDTLYLSSKAEWKLTQFFSGIGLRKPGEKVHMDWTKVPGATGRLKLEVNHYQDKNGNDRENNKVKQYLPKEAKTFTPGKF